MIFPGNCFIGALFIMLLYGGRIDTLKGKSHGFVKHMIVKCGDGKTRHFKVHSDFLPHPFCYLVFMGKVQVLRHS